MSEAREEPARTPEDSLAGISGVYVEVELRAPLVAVGMTANTVRGALAEQLDAAGITVLSVEEWHRDRNAIALRMDVANMVTVGGGPTAWQHAVVSTEIGAYQAVQLVRRPDLALPAWTWFKRGLFTFGRLEDPNAALDRAARELGAKFVAAYQLANRR